MRLFVSCFAFLIVLVWHSLLYAGVLGKSNSIDTVYRDESHCLVPREIRGDKDNPISCFCRDAIMDARYVYQTYLFTGKDRKLNGAYLTLWDYAQQMCGKEFDVLNATETKNWQWDGPHVEREYPPESEINKIQPDNEGFRTVEYKVHLTYRDIWGGVTKVENFTANKSYPAELDKLPSNTKK